MNKILPYWLEFFYGLLYQLKRTTQIKVSLLQIIIPHTFVHSRVYKLSNISIVLMNTSPIYSRLTFIISYILFFYNICMLKDTSSVYELRVNISCFYNGLPFTSVVLKDTYIHKHLVYYNFSTSKLNN
jgi:uncharacterized membrane protein